MDRATDRAQDAFPGDPSRAVLTPPPPPVETAAPARNRIVLLMMVLVSVAIGGMLHLQAGLSLPLSALGAGLALAVSATVNALAGRSSEVTYLRTEIARLELELARHKTQGMTPPGGRGIPAEVTVDAAGRLAPASLPPEARFDATAARRSRVSPPPSAAPQTSAAPAAASQHADPAEAPAKVQQAVVQGARAPQRNPQSAAAPREAAAVDSLETNDVPAWAAPSESQGDALREDWEALSRDTAPAEASARRVEPVSTAQSRTIEADLELVQRKIKALADEVNANEAMRASAAQEPVQPAGGVEESIAALRNTADRMRPARKGFSARPVYSSGGTSPAAVTVQAPPQKAASSAAASPAAPRAAPQPAPQPAFGSAPSPRGSNFPGPAPSASGGPGLLPSLDLLIPSTAQPIAVSNPARAAEPPPAQKVQPVAKPEQSAPAPAQPAFAQPAPPRHSEIARAPEAAAAAPGPAPTRGSHRPEPSPEPDFSSDRRSAPDRRMDRRFAEIAAALDHRRMDVFLNPIVGLGDYAVTHFEVDVRLKSETGSYLDGAAETLALNATDVLALFDIERLERTARVGEQLEQRGKTGSLLSPTAGPSMTDGKFLEAFAQTFEARTSISGQLVLTFTQADVMAFGPGTWQALGDMHSFGFRFALEHVTHLGMDFTGLAERGFAFVKLPAEAFLDGLPAGHGMVAPADICRHLSGAGLTLVVEAIDDDQLLARVFGFGALFGQGSLFGGARQITLDALGPKRAA